MNLIYESSDFDMVLPIIFKHFDRVEEMVIEIIRTHDRQEMIENFSLIFDELAE
jgi:hypothetical protein